MNKPLSSLASLLACALISSSVIAAGPAPLPSQPTISGDAASIDAARDKIAKSLGVGRENVRPSPVAGLFEVQHNHDFGYVTVDGKFLLQGDMVNVETGELVTENRRRADRLAAIAALGESNMIEFAPPPPIASKYVVTVFTDVDCGYCRKLHSEIAEYNADGIEMRYVFWPRTGPNTESWYRAEAVWCSADRNDALTKAKLGKPISAKKCDNPVAREYALGASLGVRGTPMLVLPDGEIVPGYVPPKVLLQHLADSDAADHKAAALGTTDKG